MTDKTTPEALQEFAIRKLAAIGPVWASSGLVERRPIEYRSELEDQFVRGFRSAEKRFHTRIAELEAEIAAVGAGGVQALSAAPADQSELHAEALRLSEILIAMGQGSSPEPEELWADGYEPSDGDVYVHRAALVLAMLAASPTPPAEQQAPNTGHAEVDRLIGRLMSSDPDFEDCRQAAALIQREVKGPDGFWTWREAAIAERLTRVNQQAAPKAAPGDGWLQSGALLYRLTDDRKPCNRDEIHVTLADGSRTPEACARRAGELLDRIRAAPQQEAQELVLEGYTLPSLPEPDLRDVGTRPQELKDFLRGYATEYARRALRFSQPAPAPLSEPIDQLERELAIIGVVGAIDGHDVVRRESVLEIARRAALAAQGGK